MIWLGSQPCSHSASRYLDTCCPAVSATPHLHLFWSPESSSVVASLTLTLPTCFQTFLTQANFVCKKEIKNPNQTQNKLLASLNTNEACLACLQKCLFLPNMMTKATYNLPVIHIYFSLTVPLYIFFSSPGWFIVLFWLLWLCKMYVFFLSSVYNIDQFPA